MVILIIELKVENISVRFKQQSVLNQCSFELQSGEVVGLIAPNGTGKTTLLNAMIGLQKIDQGALILSDTSLPLRTREAILQQLFFIESSANLYDYLTVEEHLLLVKKAWNSPIALEEAILFFNIQSFRKKKVKALSLGMKQQLILTMYLISNCPIWLMDEPLTGLDPTNVYLFNQLITHAKNKGCCILMSSHNLTNISEICTRVLFLKKGIITEDISINTGKDLDATYRQLFFTREVL